MNKVEKAEEEIKEEDDDSHEVVTTPSLIQNKCGNGSLEPLNLPEPDKCSCR